MIPKPILTWLDSNNPPIIYRLCELIAVNQGSTQIKEVGNVIPNETRWGRVGLTLDEAIELVSLSQFLFGMCQITNCIVETQKLIQQKLDILEGRSGIQIATEQELKRIEHDMRTSSRNHISGNGSKHP